MLLEEESWEVGKFKRQLLGKSYVFGLLALAFWTA